MAIPKLAMIPSGYKSGKLYSVFPADGGGDFDVTRANPASRINKQRLVETLGNNVPRLDYLDGNCSSVLLEPLSENLITYSEDFSNVSWLNTEGCIITNNAITSPTGELNATLLVANSSQDFHRISHSVTISDATEYTHSLFIKKQNYNYFTFRANLGGSNYGNVTFNINEGSLEYNGLMCEAKIKDYGNGWYRCSISYTSTGTNGTISYSTSQDALKNNTNFSYSGSGLDGVYIFGSQMEQNLYPTSYIESNIGATTPRGVETINNSGDSTIFNSLEGVLFIETSALSNDLSERRFGLSDGSSSNVIRVGYTSVSNRIIAIVYNGSNQAIMTYDNANITEYNKIAVLYKENNFELWVNGLKRSEDTIGSVFSANTINSLSFDIGGGSRFYSNTKQVQYFDTILTQEELTELTSRAPSFTIAGLEDGIGNIIQDGNDDQIITQIKI
tara:strand:+ start:39 stop:1376 length:1338 start_codon:yes stop_codon:yes gene_type:complete